MYAIRLCIYTSINMIYSGRNNENQTLPLTWYICRSWKKKLGNEKKWSYHERDFRGRQLQVYRFVRTSALTHPSYEGWTNGVVSTSVFSRNRIRTHSSSGTILFPFHAQGCNVPTKTNGRKNPPQTISIFGYHNRRSTPTIRPWSQKEEKKKKKWRFAVLSEYICSL